MLKNEIDSYLDKIIGCEGEGMSYVPKPKYTKEEKIKYNISKGKRY